MVLVVIEVDTVVTVLQFVFSYPLGVAISALRCYTGYLGVLITQINLEPWVYII